MEFNKPKSFEAACASKGYDPELPEVSKLPVRHAQAIIDHYKMVVIIEDINKCWVADWTNYSQPKWVLWPDIEEDSSKPSGLGLSCVDFGVGSSYSCVGSRLSFCCQEAAKYFFDNFSELMESYFFYIK